MAGDSTSGAFAGARRISDWCLRVASRRCPAARRGSRLVQRAPETAELCLRRPPPWRSGSPSRLHTERDTVIHHRRQNARRVIPDYSILRSCPRRNLFAAPTILPYTVVWQRTKELWPDGGQREVIMIFLRRCISMPYSVPPYSADGGSTDSGRALPKYKQASANSRTLMPGSNTATNTGFPSAKTGLSSTILIRLLPLSSTSAAAMSPSVSLASGSRIGLLAVASFSVIAAGRPGPPTGTTTKHLALESCLRISIIVPGRPRYTCAEPNSTRAFRSLFSTSRWMTAAADRSRSSRFNNMPDAGALQSMGWSAARSRSRLPNGSLALTERTATMNSSYTGESHVPGWVVSCQTLRNSADGTSSPFPNLSKTVWYRGLPNSMTMSLTFWAKTGFWINRIRNCESSRDHCPSPSATRFTRSKAAITVFNGSSMLETMLDRSAPQAEPIDLVERITRSSVRRNDSDLRSRQTPVRRVIAGL